MEHLVQVTKTEKMQEYWAVRVIKETSGKKEVVAETIFNVEPSLERIAEILWQYDGEYFVSVAHNFRKMRGC